MLSHRAIIYFGGVACTLKAIKSLSHDEVYYYYVVSIYNVPCFIVLGGEDIVISEEEASELREEVSTVEMAREELSGEVEEYVQETKAPLLEITEKVAALDIHRIRKLL